MDNTTWTVMNDIEESFSHVVYFEFLINQLQDAIVDEDMKAINNISTALSSFYPIYNANFDKKFKVAWDHVVKEKTYEY